MDEFEDRVSGGDQEVREKDWTEPPEEPDGLQEGGEYNPFRETGQILLGFWYTILLDPDVRSLPSYRKDLRASIIVLSSDAVIR